MRKVLVTGAAGFTGRYLAHELAQADYEVMGLVSGPAQADVPFPASMVRVDLLDAPALAAAVARVEPQLVVHLAAVAFVAHGSAEDIYRVNIMGTCNLLDALVALPSPPELTLLASSANIYGNAQTSGPIVESHPPAPVNDYAVSKLAMEYVAKLYADRLPLVVSRPFNYTGAGQAEHFLIPKIVAHALRGAAAIELGNIDVARDFSDVRTIVNCYRRLLEAPASRGQTLNICSGQAWTLRQVLDMVREITGRSMEIRVNPAFVRAKEVNVLRGDRSALESVIGPVADIPLRDTLRWMLDAGPGAATALATR